MSVGADRAFEPVGTMTGTIGSSTTETDGREDVEGGRTTGVVVVTPNKSSVPSVISVRRVGRERGARFPRASFARSFRTKKKDKSTISK